MGSIRFNSCLATLTIILMVGIHPTCAQDNKAIDIIAKMTEVFSTSDQLSLNVEVIGTVQAGSGETEEIGSGKIRKNKNNYYTQFAGVEMLVTKNRSLLIDHNDKTVTVFPVNSSLEELQNTQVPDVDSILQFADTVMLKNEGQQGFEIVLLTKKELINRTHLYIDRTTSLLTKVVYYYAEPTEEETPDMHKVEINYENLNKSDLSSGYFSLEKYIEGQDSGEVTLSDRYADYTLKTPTYDSIVW